MSLEKSRLSRRARFTYVPPVPGQPAAPEPELPPAFAAESVFSILPELEKRYVPPGLEEPRRGPGPIAMLVCHGMGEQVRYETLGDLARSLITPIVAEVEPTNVTLTRVHDSTVARAEILWKETDPATGITTPYEVHLYEAYWAPITEGCITYWETIKFLAEAAYTGLKCSRFGRPCEFERWMFGGVVKLPIGAGTKFALLGIFSVLAFVVAMLLLISYELANLVKTVTTGPITTDKIVHFLLPFYFTAHPVWTWVLSLAFWIAVPAFFFVRYFIIEYVGDVAAYISPFKASKFQAIRDAIQKVGLDAARLIYGFTPAEVPEYEKVILVGHSLGSVLAYDTLNAILNLDLTSHSSRRVLERTRALVTFGSPLDKTAFLFRNQPNRLDDPLREQMAAASQPLILDYSLRPERFEWINIYSPADIISGSLDYYDDVSQPGYSACRVRNMTDPDARTPLAAHVEYWKNPALSTVLRKLL